MNRMPVAAITLGILAISAGILAVSPVFAADHAGQAPMSKRELAGQIVGCMKRRMSADRYISYNQAAKDCKAQVLGRREASPTLVASDTPGK